MVQGAGSCCAGERKALRWRYSSVRRVEDEDEDKDESGQKAFGTSRVVQAWRQCLIELLYINFELP